jgi:D-glycero-D-manno-heptose 1,7-bisphosphate phosphatase
VFLDRDGTVLDEVGYLDRLDRISILPWSLDAIRLLNRAGFSVVIVTNQAGIARGFFGEAFVRETHRLLQGRVSEAGGRIDAFYYCPHLPDATVEAYRCSCDCRKPGPGMIQTAAREHGLDVTRSFVVGDRWIDVQMAHRAGATGILVETGYGKSEAARPPAGCETTLVVANLIEAVSWILSRHGTDGRRADTGA